MSTSSSTTSNITFIDAEDIFEDEAPNNFGVRISFETCENVADLMWTNNAFEKFEPFRNTAAIRIAHTGIPRAGHSNNILQLIAGSQEDASDYIVGLFVASIIILCFFLAWMVLLVFLKCMGRRKVGWLSGRRQALPRKPQEGELTLMEEENAPQFQATTGMETEDMAAAVVVAEENPQENSDKPVEEDKLEDTDLQSEKQDVEEPKEDAASTTSTQPPQTMEAWNELYKTKLKQQKWMKAVVIVSCLIVIIMAILMATRGIQSLRGSLDYGKTSINYATLLLQGGTEVVAFLSKFLKQFQGDMEILLDETNVICPRIQPFLCEDLSDVTTCNTTQVFDDETAEAFEELVQVFGQDWDIVASLDQLVEDLENLQVTATEATSQLSTIDWVFYIAVVFDVLVGLLAITMIVHLVFPGMPWLFKCLQYRCLFPLFLVFVLFSFIFAIAFLIASLALADTCADNPDERILEIANYFLQDKQPYVNEVVTRWLTQCNAPPPTIQADADTLAEINVWLDRFAAGVNVANNQLVRVCGTENPDFFSTVVGTLSGYVCASVGMMWQLKEAFECNTWLPLYYNAVHNAMCYSGTNGVWAIAATQFVTTFFTAIILTCRCVFFELEVEEEEDEDKEEKVDVKAVEEVMAVEDDDAVAEKDDAIQEQDTEQSTEPQNEDKETFA